MAQALVEQKRVVNHEKPRGYMVIRIGKLYDEDPIEELDKVIQKVDFAWFAKFGRRIAKARIEKLFKYTDPYLVITWLSGGTYDSKTYKLLEINVDEQPPRGTYPTYYKGKENFIGAWLKVSPSSYQADVQKLVVKSSYQKLTHAMGSAMGSSFVCTEPN